MDDLACFEPLAGFARDADFMISDGGGMVVEDGARPRAGGAAAPSVVSGESPPEAGGVRLPGEPGRRGETLCRGAEAVLPAARDTARAYGVDHRDRTVIGLATGPMRAKELQSIVDYSRSPRASGSEAIHPVFAISGIKDEAGRNNYPCYWSGTTHVAPRPGTLSAVYTRKHKRTLTALFRQPVWGDIKWRDAEALLRSPGAELEERAGSGAAVFLKGRTAVFHRPRPSPNLDKGAVRDLRRFLESTGVGP